jgi:hypothetical protein
VRRVLHARAIRPQVLSLAETKLTPALKLYQANCDQRCKSCPEPSATAMRTGCEALRSLYRCLRGCLDILCRVPDWNCPRDVSRAGDAQIASNRRGCGGCRRAARLKFARCRSTTRRPVAAPRRCRAPAALAGLCGPFELPISPIVTPTSVVEAQPTCDGHGQSVVPDPRQTSLEVLCRLKLHILHCSLSEQQQTGFSCRSSHRGRRIRRRVGRSR